MNAMGYPQQYPGVPGQAFNTRIVRRFLTDAERELPIRFYRMVQRGLRGISLFCIILFVLNSYVVPSVITDATTFDTVSIMLYVFMCVFGLVSIGLSMNLLLVRKRVSQTMTEGTAVEVLAPAYRANSRGKGLMWTIGPISIMPTRGLEGLLVEGEPTSVLCLPRLKAAIAINNFGLKQGARIMCPPNLEAMAAPAGPMPTIGPTPGVAYTAYGGPTMQTTQAAQDEELPPPPPPPD